MAAWPGEVIEERASEIAEAADVLLRYQGAWRHRRVETVTVIDHEQMRRHVSVDFTVPEAQREGLRISAEEVVVPLALLDKRPLVHFDLRNEEQHAIPLLTADQHRTIENAAVVGGLAGGRGSAHYTDPERGAVIAGYDYVAAWDWVIVAQESTDTTLAPVAAQRSRALL